MRYSYILTSFAASAVATPYINVELSEPSELLDEEGFKHGRRHHSQNHRDEGWVLKLFSTLWGGGDDKEGKVSIVSVLRTTTKEQSSVAKSMIDDLFGSGYECLIQSSKDQDERRSVRECCSEIGGELYDGVWRLRSPFDSANTATVQGRVSDPEILNF
jgi:hypothetical protein